MILPAHNHQRQILAASLQDRQKADPANLILAHTIGLFHYWWAKALEREGQLLIAREVWLTVIANWACVLAEDMFLYTWCKNRSEIYRVEITRSDVETLRDQLKEKLQEELTDYSELCKQAGQALAEPLYLVFELEMTAFKAMKKMGGFPIPGATGQKMICGPLMLRRLGLTSAFGDFLLSRQKASVPDVLADLQVIIKGTRSAALNDDINTRLMQYFSQLGIAALCLQSSYPDRALSSLEAIYPFLNPSLSTTLDVRTAQVPLVLDPRSPQFKERNPGYAKTESPGKLMFSHAVQLAVGAYLRQAEMSISADTADVSKAVASWQSAMALARKIGREEQTKIEVQEMILGRVIALDRSANWDETITLLDATIETYGNDTLHRKLVISLTNRGTRSGNIEQWEPSVGDLRRAYQLDAQNPRIIRNFVIALRCLAEQGDSLDRSDALLMEAITVLEAALVIDPDDTHLHDLIAEVRQELEEVRAVQAIAQDENGVSTPSELLALRLLQEGMLDEAEEEARKALLADPKRKQWLVIMSRIYTRKENIDGFIEMQSRIAEIDPSEEFNASISIGKIYKASGRYQDALDSFWKAAVTEQINNAQRSLACKLMADVLIAQERFEEAAAMVTRAIQLDPGNKEVQETQLKLKIAHPQSASDGELAELLESLIEEAEGEEEIEEAEEELEAASPHVAKRRSSQTGKGTLVGRSETVGVHTQEAAMSTIERYMKELQLKYRRQSTTTFSVSLTVRTRDTVALQVQVKDNGVFIGAALAEELPEEGAVLYNMLRATHLTDILKLCRTKSGELYIAAEVPISVLNAEILASLINGTVQFIDQSLSDLDPVLDIARAIRRQANKLETSLIKRTDTGTSPRDMIPILARRHGISCEAISRSQFLLIFGTRGFQVSAICADRSVSFIATIADMESMVHDLRYLRRMAEINLLMHLGKVALDEDNDLCFLWALPALNEELFQQMVQNMDAYLTQFVEELDSK
jgi:tetratricopeptide (TPR) repeat protein